LLKGHELNNSILEPLVYYFLSHPVYVALPLLVKGYSLIRSLNQSDIFKYIINPLLYPKAYSAILSLAAGGYGGGSPA